MEINDNNIRENKIGSNEGSFNAWKLFSFEIYSRKAI